VKTSTGIWHVAYNAENRPVVWSNGTAVVTMDYDRMGRRVGYKSISGGQTNAYSKFVYDEYLCVQRLDGFTGEVEQEYVWDPTETVATRPLTWNLPASNRTFHYFHDGNKNVSDVIDASDGSLAAHYDYAPFGAVTTATGPMADANPYRFSSEYHDTALGCVYYNYRHYNPLDGRWMSRDPIGEKGSVNIFCFLDNRSIEETDFLGFITGAGVAGIANWALAIDAAILWALGQGDVLDDSEPDWTVTYDGVDGCLDGYYLCVTKVTETKAYAYVNVSILWYLSYNYTWWYTKERVILRECCCTCTGGFTDTKTTPKSQHVEGFGYEGTVHLDVIERTAPCPQE